jgi:hypothetical protein
MGSPTLTEEDLHFLRRPLYGFLSVAVGPTPPQPRPVWFEADHTAIQIFTAPDAVKLRQLRVDPRASLVVAAPVGERERWLSVAGAVTLHDDGVHDLVRRLAARYWDLDDPARARDLAEMLESAWVRVVIRPGTVARYAM